MIEDKIDQLLQDVAAIKVISETHSRELTELKMDLKPVFSHMHFVQGVVKTLTLIGVVGGLVVGIIQLIK